MTRRVSKRTGRSYAQGSQALRGDYPAICTECGKKVRVSVDCCWYETVDGVKHAWHFACHPTQKKAA